MAQNTSKFIIEMRSTFDGLMRQVDEIFKKSEEIIRRSDEKIREAEEIIRKSNVYINQYNASNTIRKEQKTMNEGLQSMFNELLKIIKNFFTNSELKNEGIEYPSKKFGFF